MKLNLTKTLLSEVNRMREMMKLPLLVEGVGQIGDFFKTIAQKGVNSLDDFERKVLDDIIKNVDEIKLKGIYSVGDLLDDAARKTFMAVLAQNPQVVKKAFQKSVAKYADEAIKNLNTTMKSVPKLESDIKTMINNGGTPTLDILQSIESNGIENIDALRLMATRDALDEGIKTFAGDVATKGHLEGLRDYINGYISSIGVKMDDAIDLGNSVLKNEGAMGKASYDDMLSKARSAGFLLDDTKLIEARKVAESSLSDDEKLKILKRMNDDLKSKVDNAKTPEEKANFQKQYDDFRNILRTTGGILDDSLDGVLSGVKKFGGKNKKIWLGAATLAILGIAAWNWDYLWYGAYDIAGQTNDCLDMIEGYRYAVLKPAYFYHEELVQWMEIHYPPEDTCYTATSNIPEDQQIYQFKADYVGENPSSGYDDYVINVKYKPVDEGCVDQISVSSDANGNYVIGYVGGQRKCGPKKGTKVEDTVIPKKEEETTDETTGGSDFENMTDDQKEQLFIEWATDKGYERPFMNEDGAFIYYDPKKPEDEQEQSADWNPDTKTFE